MAMTPQQFHDHALRSADSNGRLPLSRMTEWDISPFEADGLTVTPLRPPVLQEPPRHGEDPAECGSCQRRDEGIWLDEHWRLSRRDGVGVPLALLLHPRDHHDLADLPDPRAAELGILTKHLVGHLEALPHIARAHVNRWGDGGAHLHVWFFARPEGQRQILGSWLVVWDDLLPPYPAALAQADADAVVDALIGSYGGSRPTAG